MSEEIAVMNKNGWLDLTGTGAAWLCALHCLLLPLAVGVLPLVGLSFLLDEISERIIIGLSAIIGGLSLIPAYKNNHRQLKPLIFFAVGIGLIVLTHLLFEENRSAETIFIIIGAILITFAHLINRRICLEAQKS